MKIKKHIQVLTLTHPRHDKFVAENKLSMEEHLELLDKVVIEKAVEERVGAGRRHSKHVEEGESYHQVLCNFHTYLTIFVGAGQFSLFQKKSSYILWNTTKT